MILPDKRGSNLCQILLTSNSEIFMHEITVFHLFYTSN